ncbi:MAG: 50S ribosomal protein L18 [Planctomycetes bacterium]|jgi:large subunit ribosomal protein L18|nr:50S ribosomal protein L18 [Planctomycetota bacterium]
MNVTVKKKLQRQRRKLRVRKHVFGTEQRPRLSVFRSRKFIYAQLIDDAAGRTLVAASSQDGSLNMSGGGNCKAAQAVGTALAGKAIEAGIKRAVFDRNGYPFHGRVKELADAARKGGLEF